MAKTKKPSELPKQGSKTDNRERRQPGINSVTPDDPSGGGMTALYAQGLFMTFIHVPTSYEVSFPAMLTSFDDSFNAEFQGTRVYGRMDQIAVYTGTTRLLNFGIDIVANTPEEAVANLEKLGRLESFMYPAYDGPGNTGTSTISAAPLIRIKFRNLIQSTNGDGLLGYINVVNTAPNFEHGFVIDDEANMYPKAYTLNVTFNVLHEHELGWYKEGESWRWRGGKEGTYPYDQQLPRGNASDNKPRQGNTAEEGATNNQQARPSDGANDDGAAAERQKKLDQQIREAKRKRVTRTVNRVGWWRD
jgi:hypothetical protein